MHNQNYRGQQLRSADHYMVHAMDVDEPGLRTFARPVRPGRQTMLAIKRHPGGLVKRKLHAV